METRRTVLRVVAAAGESTTETTKQVRRCRKKGIRELSGDARGTVSAQMRAQVAAARQIQAERFRGSKVGYMYPS